MATDDIRKQMMLDSLAVIMASESEWDALQGYIGAHNSAAAIRLATAGIERHESFLSKYRDVVSRDSQTYADHGRNLVTDYGVRGSQRLILADQGQNRSANLGLAEQDIRKALSFPDGCYQDAHMKSNLRDALNLTQAEQNGGQASSSGKSDKCFIATAAYGSPLAPEVATLRLFRETRLRPHAAGRWLIHTYEHCSPPLADAIAARPTARLWVRRVFLGPIISLIRRIRLDTTEA